MEKDEYMKAKPFPFDNESYNNNYTTLGLNIPVEMIKLKRKI